jgi:FMN phosphatase YigB (HAD superfamily)
VWTNAYEEWTLHDPTFEADAFDPERAVGPWAGHRWFAYDLLRMRAPNTVVELGTHFGVSLFAFAQAVKDGKLPTTLHAVDTWKGDPHTGLYGPEVLELFEKVRMSAYPDVDIRIHQMLFDEALPAFVDESVDMLHIDGFHSYEAAKHDYETWLPKLAPSGLVLFHDVEKETGYGSALFWDELCESHPGFAFHHSFGLGVLLPKRTDGWGLIFTPELMRWRAYYSYRWYAHLRGIQVETQGRMIDDRDAALRSQAALIDDRDTALRSQAALIDERDMALAAQARMIDDRDVALRKQTALVDQRGIALATQARMIDERDTALAQAADKIAALEGEVARLRAGIALSDIRAKSQSVRARLEQSGSRLVTKLYGHSGRLPFLARFTIANPEVRAAFDAEYYLSRNPDVAAARIDPLWHFLHYGGMEGRDPSPFFSSARYLAMYPDVAASGMNPLVHYLQYGAREGRSPSAVFDVAFYRATYADAADPEVNPLLNYLTVGIKEGRFIGPEHRRRVMAHSLSETRLVAVQEHRAIRSVVCAIPGQTPQDLPLTMLGGADVDLVTVDLWDTLVARSRPADSAKLATARREYLRHATELAVASLWQLYELRVRVETEIAASRPHQEYRLLEVLTETLTRAVPSLSATDAAELAIQDARTEWADEIETTYPMRDVWSLLDAFRMRANRPEIAVVSDFYVTSADVRAMLLHHGWAESDTPIFLSCEHMASKRLDGSLFTLVRDAFGVSADRHLHIGDNRYADYEMQLMTGGQAAMLRLTPTTLPGPGSLSQQTVDDCYEVLRSRLRETANFQVEFMRGSDASRRARVAGVLSAPLAVALVARACEAALERGLDTVHYLSREGLFLSQVHDAIAPLLARGLAKWPRAIHLEVSRRATFGASLSGATADSFARMWSMYGVQSPRAMLVSVGADPSDFRAVLQRHGLDLDTAVESIASDRKIAAFLSDEEARRRLEAAMADNRDLVLQYLAQRTDIDAESWVLVDVGWRGSIQDNLAHLVPGRLHGVYLGLFPFLNAQPEGVTKEAVGFDGNLGEEYSFAEPPAAVERPWTPHVGSTVGYRRNADGRIVAKSAQEIYASPLIHDFQEGLLDGARIVADFVVRFGFTVAMIRPAVQRDVRNYYEHPAGGVADIWFGSEHDDTFGALNITPFGKDSPDLRWLGASGEQRFAAAAMRSRWEPGFAEWLPVLSLREVRRMIEESL